MKFVFELNSVPVPKKNSRVTNRNTGRSFPNKRFLEWHEIAANELLVQMHHGYREHFPLKKYRLDVMFWMPDRRVRDSSNLFESIADLLVDMKVTEDDRWEMLYHGSFRAELNSEKGIGRTCIVLNGS